MKPTSTAAAVQRAGDGPKRPRVWLRRLRRAVLLAILVCVLLVIGYQRLANPARLRALIAARFALIQNSQVYIGDVAFSPWEGLDLVDLEVLLDPDAPLMADWPRPRAQPILRVAHLHVDLDPWALLRGAVRPTSVRVEGATLTVIRDASSGLSNWRLAPQTGAGGAAAGLASLPEILLDQADLQLYSVREGRAQLVRRWVVDAHGVAETRQSAAGYALTIDPVVTTAEAGFASAADEPLAAFWISDDTRSSESALGWLDLTALDAGLPRDLLALKQSLDLRGRARLSRLSIVDGALRSAELRVERVSLSGAVEEPGEQIAPDNRFLQFRDVSGVVALTAARPPGGRRSAGVPPAATLTIEAQGRLNDSPCVIQVRSSGLLGSQPGAASTQAATTPATRPRTVDLVLADLQSLREWAFEGSVRAESFALPDPGAHAAFLSAPALPKAVRSFFADFEPRGRLDVELRATRAAGAQSPLTLDGEFVARGTSCKYFRFPYAIDDAQGVFRLKDGAVLFDGLHGRHGAGRIRVDGRLAHTRGYAALDLVITGHSIPLDADLYSALPPRYRHLWESAAPLGVADITAVLRREEGTPGTGGREPQVRVDARLLSASLAAGGGQRLHQVRGAVTVDQGVVVVHDLAGRLDGADVRLSGVIDGSRSGEFGGTRLRLHACDVPIERRAAVSTAAGGAATDDIRFVGQGDVWGNLRGAGGVTGREARYVVHLKRGQLLGFDPAQPWLCTDGWVAMRGDAQDIRGFAARAADTWVEGSGALPGGGGAPLSLEVRCGGEDMSRLAVRIVPQRWRRYAEALGLSGAGHATIRLQRVDDDSVVDVRVEAAGGRPAPLPLPLADFRAVGTIRGGGYRIESATGRYGAGSELRLRGEGAWADAGGALDFSISAMRLPVNAEVVAAMPAALGRLIERLKLSGEIDAVLERVKRTAQGEWDVGGTLKLRNAGLALGLPLSGVAAEIAGDCRLSPDGEPDLAAGFTIDRGRLGGRPIERVEGQIVRPAGDPWVQFNELRGRLCDGEIVGFARINPNSSEYEVSLTLEDIDLEQFLPRTSGDLPPPGVSPAGASAEPEDAAQVAAPPGAARGNGRLDGRVFLRGRAGADESRRGGGELRMRGASFFKTPVLADVARAQGERGGPVSDALDQADLRFVWEGAELKLLRLEINSRDLRLVGSGRWNMDDDTLNLVLVGASPEHWPRVAILSDLIETAGQELMQYRVTGTKKNPKVAAEPLHVLTEPIRELLQPSGGG